MQHLQFKAEIIAEQQMPPEIKAQYDQLVAQLENATEAEAVEIQMQAGDILAQFSSPILAELVTEYTAKVASPSDEDPLVTIRKQELALKGQELTQENRQFLADQERRKDEALRQDIIDRERINTSEDIQEMKNETALRRLAQQKELFQQKN
jgi:hypothetical protein